MLLELQVLQVLQLQVLLQVLLELQLQLLELVLQVLLLFSSKRSKR